MISQEGSRSAISSDRTYATRRLGVRRLAGSTLSYLVLVNVSIATLIPFVSMVMLSVSPPGALDLPNLIPSSFTLEHFHNILANASLVRWTTNSLIYSVTSVVLALLLASLAGYAFAKKRFWGRDVMFWSFIAMIMIPAQVTIVPLFILIAEAGGIDTYWGLILPTLANAQAVFLMRQFIMGISDELIDAAKLDGASEFRVYWQIILPLTIPVLATLGIFIFLFHWNDFFWPLLVAQSDETRTLTVGLSTMQARAPSTGFIMAGAAFSFIPNLVIFIALQRYIAQGIALTGFR